MSEHRNEESDSLLDRAVAAMRDEAQPALPNALIGRAQAAVRDELRASERVISISPFRHPLLRVAAVFALIVTALAAFMVLRDRGAGQLATTNGTTASAPSSAPEVVDPKTKIPRVRIEVPPAAEPTVTGVIHFSGVAPKPQPLSMAANATCAAHHRGQVIDESVLVNGDGTLRNVVVWVSEGLEGRKFAPPKTPAVLDQQGCVYTPHVVPVMTGQRLLVKNSDPFLHNVRAAAAETNPPFNFGQPSTDLGGTPLTFLSPDRMFVKCDVHPWMTAHIIVLDNPYFSVTGSSGAFKLPELPPGTYTVSAWHEVFGEQKQRVNISPGRPVTLDFTFRPTQQASAESSRTVGSDCCKSKTGGTPVLTAGL